MNSDRPIETNILTRPQLGNCNDLLFKSKVVLGKGLNLILPGDNVEQEDENTHYATKLLQRAFVPSLLEAMIILSANATATHYLKKGTPWFEYPLLSSSAYLGANFFTRLYKGHPVNGSLARRGLRLMRSALFSVAATALYIWIHEGGHALTSLVLYKDANPKIEFLGGWFAPQGANTVYDPSTLTAAGEALGKDNSQTLVNAMGTGTSVLMNFLQLISAQVFSDNYPEIKSYLRATTLFNLLISISYGISGYGDCKENNNDFCNLNKAGFSPALIISLVVVSVLFLQLSLSGITYCLNKTKTSEEDNEPEYAELVNINSEEENESSSSIAMHTMSSS